MFRVQIMHRYAVGSVQTPEFQNYVQVMFRPIIRTDKKYVERRYTIFITLGKTLFHAFFVTYRCVITRFPSIEVSNVYI